MLPFSKFCMSYIRNLKTSQFKTESARRWSNKWTKTLYQDYLHCIANFCRALSVIYSKQFIYSNTKRRKRMLNFVWNTWSFGEMKLMMKFCLCFHKITELWNLFSLVPVGNYFSVLFHAVIMYLASKKCKNDCKIF